MPSNYNARSDQTKISSKVISSVAKIHKKTARLHSPDHERPDITYHLDSNGDLFSHEDGAI